MPLPRAPSRPQGRRGAGLEEAPPGMHLSPDFEISRGALFLALFIGGESILLPAFYLAMKGHITFPELFALGLGASLGSDTLIYLVGRFTPWRKIESSEFVRKRITPLSGALAGFRRHQLRFLLLSRFVYGTRSAVQLLCGATRLPWSSWLAVNVFGTAAWLGILFGLVLGTGRSLASLQADTLRIQLSFLVLVVFLILTQLWIRKLLPHLASRPSSPPSTKPRRSPR